MPSISYASGLAQIECTCEVRASGYAPIVIRREALSSGGESVDKQMAGDKLYATNTEAQQFAYEWAIKNHPPASPSPN